ncbi:hypothetical protein WJX72_010092 [[Myrmecia] bisecta]|uniref:NmrA-like domain-containing protein n=1 Tax=[Myrmecia] bisecta TaxID=41462 RepID=A0AAW1QS62_9CHLO
MAGKQTIVVIGATGAQGGGVVDGLLKANKFVVKGVTRNIDSPAAQKLAAEGVIVVKADLGDKASLLQAFQGADGVFIVTDFFGGAKNDPAVEIRHGTNAVDAAKEANVKHAVLSTLEDPTEVVPKGAYREAMPDLIVPHFQTKAAIAEHLRQSGVPHTLLLTSFFFENFSNGPYLKYLDGSYGYISNLKPDAAVPAHAVGDIGATAAVIFSNPSKYVGKTVPVAYERFKLPDALQIISDVTGKRFKYVHLSDKQFWSLPFPGGLAKDLSNMFRYYGEFTEHVVRLRDPANSVYKGPTLREWAQAHKDRLANPPSVGMLGTLFLTTWVWISSLVFGS